MTDVEARAFLTAKRAAYTPITGWQIAHEIAGDLEWFSVTEEDADRLARLAQGERS